MPERHCVAGMHRMGFKKPTEIYFETFGCKMPKFMQVRVCRAIADVSRQRGWDVDVESPDPRTHYTTPARFYAPANQAFIEAMLRVYAAAPPPVVQPQRA